MEEKTLDKENFIISAQKGIYKIKERQAFNLDVQRKKTNWKKGGYLLILRIENFWTKVDIY